MKTAKIEEVPGGFEITLHLDKKTPSGCPIISNYKVVNFEEAIKDLTGYFGGRDEKRKAESDNPQDTRGKALPAD